MERRQINLDLGLHRRRGCVGIGVLQTANKTVIIPYVAFLQR